ncbi:hypothetical protein [Variovorax sp. HJSM1_2]|uniref:hypothetical protein n=1 Tax=Variovorax sp. HJSM1_2 TaxID=3366263 RepID=UPI003BB9AE5F
MPSRHAPPWVFVASHSHLYAGARLRSATPVAQLPLRVGELVIIAFSDQATATGQISQLKTAQDWTLHLYPRTTAKGTQIAAQTWRVGADETDTPEAARTLRVRRP